MKVSKSQSRILKVGAIPILAALLYPPWSANGRMRFAWISDQPVRSETGEYSIYWTLLLIEWA